MYNKDLSGDFFLGGNMGWCGMGAVKLTSQNIHVNKLC